MPYAEVDDIRMYYASCQPYDYRLPGPFGRTTQPQQAPATDPATRAVLLRLDSTHPKRSELHIDTG